jgi:N-acetylmuramoyl-L-alanine amidase
VLIGASMPSVLAEIGFPTNSADETLLHKPDYR